MIYMIWVFPRHGWIYGVKIVNTIAKKMRKLAHLQWCLEDMFHDYTPQFLNKNYWIQLQYKVQEKHNRILVFVRIFHQDADYAVMKSVTYCRFSTDLDFLRVYLVWVVLTLGIK